MSLEVGEVHHKVVVGEMTAHDVVFHVLLVPYRYAYVTVLVHYVHSRNAVETVLVYRLPVGFRGVALARISSVALHNGAVHFIYKTAYKRRFEIVVPSGLACAYLYRHTTGGFFTQCFVYFDKSFGTDVLCKIDFRLCL